MKSRFLILAIISLTVISCKKNKQEKTEIQDKFMSFTTFQTHQNNLFQLKNKTNSNKIISFSQNLHEDNLREDLRGYVYDETGNYGTESFDNSVENSIPYVEHQYPTMSQIPSDISSYNINVSGDVETRFTELTNFQNNISNYQNLPSSIKTELGNFTNGIKGLGTDLVGEYSNNTEEPSNGDMHIYNTLLFGLEEKANSLYAVVNNSSELDYYQKQSLLYEVASMKDNFIQEAQNSAVQGYLSPNDLPNGVAVTSLNSNPKVLSFGSFLKKVIIAILAVTITFADNHFENNVYAHDGLILGGVAASIFAIAQIGSRGFRWIDSW
jgi:hypothetical protein